jgi:hypothetical protein
MSIKSDDILDIVKDRLKYKAYWSEVEEKNLRKDIFDLQQDLQAYCDSVVENDEDFDDFVLDDEEDEYVESYDDLVIGIDNILDFDLENEFLFNKYDFYFFFFTALFLILNGYIIFAFFYIQFGFNLIIHFENLDVEIKEMDKLTKMSDFTIRAFYILDNNRVYKVIELNENEKISFSTNCLYNNINHNTLNDGKQLDFMKSIAAIDYNKFNKKYFDIIYYNEIIFYNRLLKKKDVSKIDQLCMFNENLEDSVYEFLMLDINHSSFLYKNGNYVSKNIKRYFAS